MQLYGKHIHEGDFSLSSLPTLPSAVKFVSIEGHEDRQLSDLALHRHDLSFVTDCLRELNATSSDFLRSALWQLAVITFIKCFVGSSARIQLDASAIFGKTPSAMEAYRYIKNLRDKHFVHDENAYSQCVPALAIGDGTKGYNIEKVIALSSTGVTLDQSTFNKLDLAAIHRASPATRMRAATCGHAPFKKNRTNLDNYPI